MPLSDGEFVLRSELERKDSGLLTPQSDAFPRFPNRRGRIESFLMAKGPKDEASTALLGHMTWHLLCQWTIPSALLSTPVGWEQGGVLICK